MKLSKWNWQKHIYEDYEVPDEWHIPLYTLNMDEIINCPHCGDEFRYGDSYTSLEFHNQYGLGFPVCDSCYQKEWKRKEKYKEKNNE